MMKNPSLGWDIGTAYDLFVSMKAIHQPLSYGIRASWAAGVRSRLPMELRETLELTSTAIHLPLHWLYSLPQPKNAATVLTHLEKIPSSERLITLAFPPHIHSEYRDILINTNSKHEWSTVEVKVLRNSMRSPYHIAAADYLDVLRKVWTNQEQIGQMLYPAYKAFIDGFFIEEETRIIPSIQVGLAHAQARSGSLPIPALLEELSMGVRFGDFLQIPNLILAPSFWGSPFVFYDFVDSKTNMLLFGSRPDDCALIPGDIIPESLLRGLKALADPTRLRILRNLADGPLTPTQLARSLRLRTPTVTHHLLALRLAGLIQVIISLGGERRYATRVEGLGSTQETLEKFVNGE